MVGVYDEQHGVDNGSTTEPENRIVNSVDIIKLYCCILIVGSHCLPIFRSSEANFYFGQWFFRFCVPFFFITTGYFFTKMDADKRKNYIKRIIILYALSSVIYLPFYIDVGAVNVVLNIILGYRHLWYLSALVLGLLMMSVIDRVSQNYKFWLIPILGVMGVLLDEYYRLLDFTVLNKIASLINHLGGARHAMFFALPMLLIGELIAKKQYKQYKQGKRALYILFLLMFVLSFFEAFFLKSRLGQNITLDVSIFGWTPAVPLFLIGLNMKTSIAADCCRKLRKITDIVYIVHIWIIAVVTKVFEFDYLGRFLMTSVVSFAFATAIEWLILRGRKSTIS